MNHLTLERFAAFLDGNLPEADMQAVAAAIDADPSCSAVLGKAMEVDDLAGWYAGQPEVMAEALAAEDDFVLPEVPVAVEPDEGVTLHYVAAEEPEVAAVACAEAVPAACAEPLCGEEPAAEENDFVKPNEQSQTGLSFAMARNCTFKNLPEPFTACDEPADDALPDEPFADFGY
ncbi:MAG: hypothetical protein ACI3YD_08155 [Alloprevotella sp.]